MSARGEVHSVPNGTGNSRYAEICALGEVHSVHTGTGRCMDIQSNGYSQGISGKQAFVPLERCTACLSAQDV